MTDREEQEALTEDSENVVKEVLDEDNQHISIEKEEALTEDAENVVGEVLDEDNQHISIKKEEALTEESEIVVVENVLDEVIQHISREEEEAWTDDLENMVEENVFDVDIQHISREEEETWTEDSETVLDEDTEYISREEQDALAKYLENVFGEDGTMSIVWDEGDQYIARPEVEDLISPLTNRYCGNWDVFGLDKEKLYGVVYDGKFYDGQYHGEGTLTYPMGHKFHGTWSHGQLTNYKFEFPDSLEYEDNWKYCKMPDRRFFACVQDGLRPAGRSLLTNDEHPRRIPEGCYDTVDGYYNPKTKCVMSAIHPGHIIRIPKKAEEAWIMQHCRKAWDQPTEYNPKLYEKWVSGRRGECDNL